MKIRIRAILVILSANAVILLLSILAGIGYVRENIETYIEEDMLVVADIADRFISSELDLLRMEAAEAAGALQAAGEENWPAALARQAARHPQFTGMAVLGQSGEVGAAAGAAPATAALLESEAAQSAFLGEAAFTSTVPSGGGVVFYLAVPMPGAPRHILALTLDGAYFSDLASEYHVWETGHIFIDDGEGTVIANIRPEWVGERQNFIRQAQGDAQYDEVASVVQKAISGERGIGYYSVSGVSRICAYRPITGSAEGWCLGIVAPLSESPVRNVDRGLLLIAAVSFLLNIAAAVIASGFIKRPFEQVAALKERAEADLTENRKMLAAIEQRDELLQTVNTAIDRLLRAEPDDFSAVLHECMGMMARAVSAGSMYFVKNDVRDGKLYRVRLYQWFEDDGAVHGDGTVHISHDGGTPEIKETLLRGDCVNVLVRHMTSADSERLLAQGIRAVLLAPVFIRGDFWGFAGFNNSRSEQLYSKNQESVLRSGSLLIASALLRNEYLLSLRDASARLKAALDDAWRANNAKSSFLAHMSHEIRTPLNAVIGLSELTLGEEELPGEAAANLEKINVAGATILSIVNDILDISKIESGKLTMYPAPYDTPSLINDVVTLNVVRIGEKPVQFSLVLDENLPGALCGDDLRVKQIFNNLLSNAFKYTNAGTVQWHVSFRREGDFVWLVSSVKDTGIGMTPDSVKKLFTDYNQVDAGTNRKVEGTGLGLAIAQRLAQMMDGAITVESEYGRGSAFHVRLRQGFVSDAPIGKEVAGNLTEMRYTLSRRDKNTRLPRVDLSYARVLVVDDIATNLDVVKGMLKPYGVKIDCAAGGPQAIEMIRAGTPRYSAVFMDHMMPGMDGMEATRIIREEIGTEYAKSIPVVALTANAIVGNEEMFLSRGFQDFISKPIDVAKLDAVLRRWVRDKTREGEALPPGGPAAPPHPTNAPAAWDGAAVEGMELQKALERFDGDTAVLADILRSYAAGTPPLLAQLEGALAAGNLAAYAIAVHGVKGSSAGIFARETARDAERLEGQAKAGNLDAVRAGHPAFARRAEELVRGIQRLLGAAQAAAPKPDAAEPDAALLREVREGCRAFAMDRVDAAMARLEAFRYERGEALVTWLRGKIRQMAFEEIADGVWPPVQGVNTL